MKTNGKQVVVTMACTVISATIILFLNSTRDMVSRLNGQVADNKQQIAVLKTKLDVLENSIRENRVEVFNNREENSRDHDKIELKLDKLLLKEGISR